MSSRFLPVTALVCGVLASCTQNTFETPLPRDVTLAVARIPEQGGPWRIAVVWTLGDTRPGFVVTDDRVVEPAASELTVRFELPAGLDLGELTPVESATLSGSGQTVPVYRPRVVLYEDRDGDGRFGTESLGGQGSDLMVGIDDDATGMGAILDLEQVLQALPLDASEVLYAATDGRYTPFVLVASGQILRLTPGSQTSVPIPTLLFEGGGRPRASFECYRQEFESLWAVTEQELVLDEALDPGLCDLSFGSCELQELDTMPAPELAGPLVQCRRVRDLVALLIQRNSSSCTGCACETAGEQRVLIAAEAGTPDWWPCGQQVSYCESALPITELEVDCIVNALDQGG